MKDEDYLDTARDWMQLFLIALFACICAGIVYEIAQPWANEVISNWEFKP